MKDPLQAIQSQSRIVEVDFALAAASGTVHAAHRLQAGKFSLSDAFVLAAARVNGAKILTTDTDFRGIKEAVIISK